MGEIFIGARDPQNIGGVFRWDDGNVLTWSGFSNLHEIDNRGCVVVKQNGKWKTERCQKDSRLICENQQFESG